MTTGEQQLLGGSAFLALAVGLTLVRHRWVRGFLIIGGDNPGCIAYAQAYFAIGFLYCIALGFFIAGFRNL